MNTNNEGKKLYDPIEELIKIGEKSINKLAKKNIIIKIRTTIIMCSTLILSCTILRPIITISLIGSSLINIWQAYYLKNKTNNIQKRKKAIGQINKFLNLDKNFNNSHDNVLDKLRINSQYRNDLYECIWTNDIKCLQNITQKYEEKVKEEIILIKKNQTTSDSSSTSSSINKSITTQRYQQNHKKQPINGHQFVKKLL
ncbi:MAG: hypothetical protein HFI86_03840 [Bacilli bacterium]|nr:hypothetical protein [Bacilli bacterium]